MIKPDTEKKSMKKAAVTIKAGSMRPKIARNVVDIIIPGYQIQVLRLNVPYEKIINRHAKTGHEIEDIVVPKNNIEYTDLNSVCGQESMLKLMFKEKIHQMTNIIHKANQSKARM